MWLLLNFFRSSPHRAVDLAGQCNLMVNGCHLVCHASWSHLCCYFLPSSPHWSPYYIGAWLIGWPQPEAKLMQLDCPCCRVAVHSIFFFGFISVSCVKCLLDFILMNTLCSIRWFCPNGTRQCLEILRYIVLYQSSRCHCWLTTDLLPFSSVFVWITQLL